MVELTELKSSTLADGVETSLLEYIRRSAFLFPLFGAE